MKTYQDFQAAENKLAFINEAINEFISSEQNKNALQSRQYARQENEGIFGRQFGYIAKQGAGAEGRDVYRKSIFKANNQIANGMYGKIVQQKVQYCIGNGIVVEEVIKKKLPKHTDRSVQRAGLNAAHFGVSWGFPFINDKGKFDFFIGKGEEFIPLKDKLTDELMAGIRFWVIENANKQERFIELYEMDGMTTYHGEGANLTIEIPKTAYKLRITRYPTGATIINSAENPYGRLPVFPFYNNEERTSDFRKGTKRQLDLYDIIMSDFGNNLEDYDDIYWVIKNYDGQDLAQFKEEFDRYKALKVGDNGEASPHHIEVPYQAREVALKILRQQIYSDQMALDIESIRGGSLTNVAIKVAQSDLDLKASEFEWGALDFVEQLLEFWKIYANHSGDIEVGDFVRRTFINDTEIISNLAMSTDLSEQTRTERHPYAAKDEMKRKEQEAVLRYNMQGVSDDEPTNEIKIEEEQ